MKIGINRALIVLVLIPYLIACEKKSNPVNAEPDEQVQGFTHVNLVTMRDQSVLTDQTVLIDGTRISTVGPSADVAIPEGIRCLDGTGYFLMPGLADMHMHTRQDWMTDRWPVIPLLLYLANGITTVRDFGPNGDDLTYPLVWKADIDAGDMAGPYLYTSGMQVRYDTGTSLSPQQIVTWNHTQGFDFLKIYSYVSYTDFQEAMAAATQLGMYTAGHIPYPVGFEYLVTEGYSEIAHIEELDWEFIELDRDTVLAWGEWLPYLIGIVLQEYDIQSGFNQSDFQERYGAKYNLIKNRLIANNIPICTTMMVDQIIVEKLFNPAAFLSRPELRFLPQDYLTAFNQGVEKHQVQFRGIEDLAIFKYEFDRFLLKDLHLSGIMLLLSTDSGTGTMGIVPGYSIHDELHILTDNGFTPYEAIATGTVNASRVVERMTGIDEFGTIETGKRADLLLIEGNPLEAVNNIKNIKGVMANGTWYSRKTLDVMTGS